MDNLSISEELNIEEMMRTPYLSYVIPSLQERRRIAYSILERTVEEILLIDSYGFLIDSVFAGLSENHIEYVAKNGPKAYKENLIKVLQDQEMINGAHQIAKSMDDDLSNNQTINQNRLKKVIQYIKDNKLAFQF